ncbi:hypothetical protein C8T65DRAFT_165088, partial [Cerioporus squamosus]
MIRGTSAYIHVPSRALPRELSDMVIDYLHGDKPCLKRCSLVCKSWTHRSQRHLFASITVDSSAKSHSHAATILFSPFLSAKPEIASHIMVLVIKNENRLPISTLRSIVISLPELLILKLRSCSITDCELPQDQAKSLRPPQVHPM